ncbi:CarD family transcriptional regulator [Pseudoflavonifractor sp. MSJ-37]|uniref:CarD family transcriptional regulator n=1 Tax=Pseudoflavonifractor sp. MSJ-37 TaxID=2841531 RepID=UPI001C0FBFE2|nr:CarD family transcriptional regulator [Pseudoflavonifractor sp. MSJ-37]MBU5435277.1 CarD family transcriptional regulator [Pseudoflavonifractor sp. MSJ-37]
MYPVGSLIVYGRNGVCRVRDVAPRPGDKDGRLYYTLEPIYTKETIIAPVDTKVALRPVLTREEAEALVRSIPSIETETIEIRSLPALSRYYQEAYHTSDCVELLRLIKTIRLRSQEAIERGRRPGKLDERYLHLAEEQLYGELSVALELEREAVPDYIRETLEEAS